MSSSGEENLNRFANAVQPSTVATTARMVESDCHIAMLPIWSGLVLAAVCKDLVRDRFGRPRRVDSADFGRGQGAAIGRGEACRWLSGPWRLDHVLTPITAFDEATYSAAVDWPTGRRTELLGASARAGGRSGNDERAVDLLVTENVRLRSALYPKRPYLPGIATGGRGRCAGRSAQRASRLLIIQ